MSAPAARAEPRQSPPAPLARLGTDRAIAWAVATIVGLSVAGFVAAPTVGRAVAPAAARPERA